MPQLRVHCAEVLGTPIVGDYKYGWQAHRKWGGFDLSNVEDSCEELFKEETLPFGLNLNNGSISENHPRLHLHCKQIVLPNISQALQNVQSFSNCDLSQVERLELVADLPLYMQRSWDVTNCWVNGLSFSAFLNYSSLDFYNANSSARVSSEFTRCWFELVVTPFGISFFLTIKLCWLCHATVLLYIAVSLN